MSLWLAFFNQAFASTSIINYAPAVGGCCEGPGLRRMQAIAAACCMQVVSEYRSFLPECAAWPPLSAQVLQRAGVESHTAATLLTSAVGGSKVGEWAVLRRGIAADKLASSASRRSPLGGRKLPM